MVSDVIARFTVAQPDVAGTVTWPPIKTILTQRRPAIVEAKLLQREVDLSARLPFPSRSHQIPAKRGLAEPTILQMDETLAQNG